MLLKLSKELVTLTTVPRAARSRVGEPKGRTYRDLSVCCLLPCNIPAIPGSHSRLTVVRLPYRSDIGIDTESGSAKRNHVVTWAIGVTSLPAQAEISANASRSPVQAARPFYGKTGPHVAIRLRRSRQVSLHAASCLMPCMPLAERSFPLRPSSPSACCAHLGIGLAGDFRFLSAAVCFSLLIFSLQFLLIDLIAVYSSSKKLKCYYTDIGHS